MYRYYIAYCCIEDSGTHSFGDMVITNNEFFKIRTIDDIETIKNFIIKSIKEQDDIDIKAITIMDFRELEGEN